MSEKHGYTASSYTTNDDFCRIFTQQMNQLYLLAYLLTGEAKLAEQCFVEGMADCVGGNPIFKEWANSWARRTIIKNAVGLKKPGHSGPRFEMTSEAKSDLGRLAPVAGLPDLERFVFVMLVLEKYSLQECAVLLNSTRRDVGKALARALTEVAQANVAPLPSIAGRGRDLRSSQFWNGLGMPEAKPA